MFFINSDDFLVGYFKPIILVIHKKIRILSVLLSQLSTVKMMELWIQYANAVDMPGLDLF